MAARGARTAAFQSSDNRAVKFQYGDHRKAPREAFVRRLAELGWIEGRTVMIEDRSGEGSAERAGAVAAEFVQLKVDVMVMAGDAQGLAAKAAAPAMPIVLAAAGDPVGHGLVASLARPGGNITGFSVHCPTPPANG
jgi:putative ABC transport system substrate-binding protein